MKARWIFCGGMQRAGSTLQYQIASELIERLGVGKRVGWHDPHSHASLLTTTSSGELRTLKTHELTPPVEALCRAGGASALYIVRDVRDVICSLMKMQSMDFGRHEIEEKVRVILRRDAAWRALPGAYVARYEEVSKSLVAEVDRTAAFLDLDNSGEMARQIAADLSSEAQLRTLGAVVQWRHVNEVIVFDEVTLLHRRHLNGGIVGRYKTELRRDQRAIIEAIAGDWLQEMGYSA